MLPDTSRFFEQGMADRQNALTQYNIGTGRRPTADQEYSFGQGMMSPLLAYDLKRRQMAQERWDRLAQNWKTGHDARKAQSSDFERYTKGIIGGTMMLATPLTGGLSGIAGAGLLGSALSGNSGSTGATNTGGGLASNSLAGMAMGGLKGMFGGTGATSNTPTGMMNNLSSYGQNRGYSMMSDDVYDMFQTQDV